LGNPPNGSQLPEPLGGDLVQSKSGPMSHDRHTIVYTIIPPFIKANVCSTARMPLAWET
jgi:hypothetical protein